MLPKENSYRQNRKKKKGIERAKVRARARELELEN